jgi:hypothetical protein
MGLFAYALDAAGPVSFPNASNVFRQPDTMAPSVRRTARDRIDKRAQEMFTCGDDLRLSDDAVIGRVDAGRTTSISAENCPIIERRCKRARGNPAAVKGQNRGITH